MVQIPLTPEAFQSLSQKAAAYGLELTAPGGTLSKSGVTARYTYDQHLFTVEILQKPFFVSTEYCEEQLMKYLGR